MNCRWIWVALLTLAGLGLASSVEAEEAVESEPVYVTLSDRDDEPAEAADVATEPASDGPVFESIRDQESDSPATQEEVGSDKPAVASAEQAEAAGDKSSPAAREEVSPSDRVAAITGDELASLSAATDDADQRAPARATSVTALAAGAASPPAGLPYPEARPRSVLPQVNPEDTAPPGLTVARHQRDAGPTALAGAHALVDLNSTALARAIEEGPQVVEMPQVPAAAACDALACDDGSCCLPCCPTCCGLGRHTNYFFAELLALRARNTEVPYAVPADGPVGVGQTPIQFGSMGILDPDFETGFRLGLNVALDSVSSLEIRYTLFESLTEDRVIANAPYILRSLVSHPSTATAAADALEGSGSLEIDFDAIDLAFRHVLHCGDLSAVHYVLGGRYGKLEQQFAARYIKTGTEDVRTDLDFEGGGLRLGLEAVRQSCRNRLQVYANGYASFLAGRFRGSYFQGHSFDPEVVDVEWEAGRVVPVLDLECGIGWVSADQKLRLSAGYSVSAWYRAVVTRDLIEAVQTNHYDGLSETVTFDGLQARFEYRY